MKAAIIGIAITLVVYMGLSIFGAVAIMEIPRLPLNDTPASVELTYEDVSFTSRGDGVVLRGWYVPSEREFIIIIVHGGFQNRVDYNVDTLGLTHDLVERGYDLLLFDLRGRGESEGKGLSLSNIERDIGGAVDYLKSKGYSEKSIGIIGFCSGAASSCIFASLENIGALVLDGCFATVNDMVTKQAALRGIPEFLLDLFIPGVLFATKIIYSYQLVDPIDVVTDVACPILFIHEERDNIISLKEVHQLFEMSTNSANELWEVSAAEHSQAYKTYPAQYVERVDAFFASKKE